MEGQREHAQKLVEEKDRKIIEIESEMNHEIKKAKSKENSVRKALESINKDKDLIIQKSMEFTKQNQEFKKMNEKLLQKNANYEI